MRGLAGKKAIVTGAGQGIGLAIAERLVAEGVEVLIVDRNEDGARESAARLGQHPHVADVGDPAQIQAMIDDGLRRLGAIDILVNNAGISASADLSEASIDDFDRVMAVNVRSCFLASQAAGAHMIARGRGTIVNMSSVTARLGVPSQIAYCTSKAAVSQLTTTLALALAPHGIRVNAVGPGSVLTDAMRAFCADPAARSAILARTPLGRMADPAEIAAVAAFLASDEASFITGQTIFADGGRLGLNYMMPVD